MITNQQLLRLPQVLAATGQKPSQLYAEIKKGRFPKQVKLSERCVAWRATEVEAWIESRQVAV